MVSAAARSTLADPVSLHVLTQNGVGSSFQERLAARECAASHMHQQNNMHYAHACCGSTGQNELRGVMEERVQRARREATRFMDDAVQVTSPV
jgi:hypothetical protein